MRTREARLRPFRWAAAAFVAFGAAAMVPAVAGAQYFGRNKVQYENFDWNVVHTPHFDVHFYPAESLLANDVSRMAERWYTRFTPALRDTFSRRSIILYANSPDFQQTNVVSGLIGEGTGGVTESVRGRVTMPAQDTYGETDHVLGHEMVHVYQYVMAFSGTSPNSARGFQTIPLWATEGMAEYFSVGRNDPHTAMWMRDAVWRNDMPSLKDLSSNPRYFPYRYGQAFWAWFGGVFGDVAIERVYRNAIRQGWEQALRAVTGAAVRLARCRLAARDHRALHRRSWTGAPRPTRWADSSSAVVTGRGEQNVSPAVSADGRLVAFFSSRELFGFTLYVADVATGKVVKKLSTIGGDPHFDALSFISSSGTWSPDGRQLAFVVQAQGDDEIDVFSEASGDISRRIKVRGVEAISDPGVEPGRQAARLLRQRRRHRQPLPARPRQRRAAAAHARPAHRAAPGLVARRPHDRLRHRRRPGHRRGAADLRRSSASRCSTCRAGRCGCCPSSGRASRSTRSSRPTASRSSSSATRTASATSIG